MLSFSAGTIHSVLSVGPAAARDPNVWWPAQLVPVAKMANAAELIGSTAGECEARRAPVRTAAGFVLFGLASKFRIVAGAAAGPLV